MENDIRLKNDIAKKIIKLILKIAYQLLVILCVIIIIIIVLQKLTNSSKTIFGYRIFRVITGSMEPKYDVGEVVVCKEVNPEEIEIGDDIVYLGTYGEYNGKIIMHEVIQIERDENNELNFHAKGLHSASVEDPQVKANQIFGVVIFKSKILTLLYRLATSTYAAFFIAIALVLNIFFSFKNSRMNKLQELNERNEDFSEDEEFVEDEDSDENLNENENTNKEEELTDESSEDIETEENNPDSEEE